MPHGISRIAAERLEHRAELAQLPVPKTEHEAMQLFIKAQADYFVVSKKHISLLANGMTSREEWVGNDGPQHAQDVRGHG